MVKAMVSRRREREREREKQSRGTDREADRGTDSGAGRGRGNWRYCHLAFSPKRKRGDCALSQVIWVVERY